MTKQHATKNTSSTDSTKHGRPFLIALVAFALAVFFGAPFLAPSGSASVNDGAFCVASQYGDENFHGEHGNCGGDTAPVNPGGPSTEPTTPAPVLAAVSAFCTDHDGFYLDSKFDSSVAPEGTMYRIQFRDSKGEWKNSSEEVNSYSSTFSIYPQLVRETTGETAESFSSAYRIDYSVNGVRSETSEPQAIRLGQQFESDAIFCG